jgi:hypothetical protein
MERYKKPENWNEMDVIEQVVWLNERVNELAQEDIISKE